jgi:hypothetical protein
MKRAASINPIDDAVIAMRGSQSMMEMSPLVEISSKFSQYPDEEMILQLIDEGIKMIVDLTKLPDYPSEDIKGYFQGLLKVLPASSDVVLAKLKADLPTNLFAKSSVAFEIFLSYFFSANISDNTGLQLFSVVVTNTTLHSNLRKNEDLSGISQVIIKYYEGGNSIWDKSLSANLSCFIRNTFVHSDLFELFSQIHFSNSMPDFHLAPLYHEFMVKGTMPERIHFIQVLVDTRSLHHFDSVVVTQTVPARNIFHVLSQISIRTTKDCWGNVVTHPAFSKNNLTGKGHPLEMNSLNNTVFVEHVRHFTNQVRTKVQSLFVRIMFYAALKENISEQFNTRIDTTAAGQVSRMTVLLNTFEGLSLCGMNSYVLQRIHDAIPSQSRCNFSDVVYRLRDILEHTASVDVGRVNELILIKKRVGKIKNGRVAVQDVFTNIYSPPDISNWAASSLNDRLFYTYCFVKYPLQDFKLWATQLNDGKDFASNLITPQFYDRFDEHHCAKHLIGIKDLPKHGYKFIQNSQLFAVFCALDATKKGLHFFGKLGTGQGKSLVFALLAIQYVKQGKKVVCFSCYDHLAKRDHAAFKDFLQENGVTSKHLSSGTKEEFSADVLYANMDTFTRICYLNVQAIAKGEKDYIFDINSFTVALLDEFDALLIDSTSIGNWVYDQFKFLNLTRSNSVDAAKIVFNNFINGNPDFQLMLERLAEDGNQHVFKSWSETWSTKPPSNSTDCFGFKRTYVGGKWHQLSEGEFELRLCQLDVLSYLLGIKTIVGLSGSISRETITHFRPILKKADETDGFAYIEIPNFYGLKSGKNILKTQRCDCGSQWTDLVQMDLISTLQKNPPVPVLLFGDVNKNADWVALKTLIETAAKRYNRKVLIIETEAQVEPLTMAMATDPQYITLATHIVGRGADFKVRPEISRAGGGMHVLITAVPNDDHRLLVQMIGRTARMDNDGTHSIILRGSRPKQDIEPLKINNFYSDLSIVNRLVNQQLVLLPYKKAHWEKWFLLLNAIRDSSTWPGKLIQLANTQRAERLLYYITDKGLGYFRSQLNPPEESAEREGCCTIM